jgi:hypothetical protein
MKLQIKVISKFKFASLFVPDVFCYNELENISKKQL